MQTRWIWELLQNARDTSPDNGKRLFAAEKYIKAFLVRHQVEFPKTHDIGRLRQLVAHRDAALAERLEKADVLTPYGVDMRYPEEFEVVSQKRAECAVALAE